MSADEPERTSEPAKPVLAYQPPSSEPPARPGDTFLGCLSAGLLIVFGVIAIAFVSYAYRLPDWLGLATIGCFFIIPLSIGLRLLKWRRWNALAVGLLIGTGLAALLEGLCLLSSWK